MHRTAWWWGLAFLGLLASVLRPGPSYGHARLLSPAPRSAAIGKTGPCGGVARTASPHVLDAGQVLQVDWEETVDHPGYYRLLFSAAGDTGFGVLLDLIPDRAFQPGETEVTYSATVVLPVTPCLDCTLQLIQVMTENPTSPDFYYSCADVRLRPASTTTTTLGPPSVTTTTLAPSPCASLAGLAALACRFTGALAEPLCAGADPAMERALEVPLRRAEALVARAADGATPEKAGRLLARADRRLRALGRRAAHAADAGRLDPGCSRDVADLVSALRAAINAGPSVRLGPGAKAALGKRPAL